MALRLLYCFFARYARGRVNFYSICECVLLYILHITAADAFPGAVVYGGDFENTAGDIWLLKYDHIEKLFE